MSDTAKVRNRSDSTEQEEKPVTDEERSSDDTLPKENSRKRTYVPKIEIRQLSVETQETNTTSAEDQPEEPGDVETSDSRSEVHRVPIKRKRIAPARAIYQSPNLRQKHGISCHSRTHLKFDPNWTSPRTVKQHGYQIQTKAYLSNRTATPDRSPPMKKRTTLRRRSRAKTASGIIKLKVNGNRVTPLIKTSPSTSEISVQSAEKIIEEVTEKPTEINTKPPSRMSLAHVKRTGKSTSVERQPGTRESATQTTLVKGSTTTEEVQTSKKKKSWFARH